MESSFQGLMFGLIFSIALVYALIVVNFQSWLDPFIIIAALPGALAGIVWMLFVTGTHVSVPALTGSIMCMGVATANSILVDPSQRSKWDWPQRNGRSAGGGLYSFSAGDYDGVGDDHWHGAYGTWTWRRWRAKCAAGPRGDRRTASSHLRHTDLCSGRSFP